MTTSLIAYTNSLDVTATSPTKRPPHLLQLISRPLSNMLRRKSSWYGLVILLHVFFGNAFGQDFDFNNTSTITSVVTFSSTSTVPENETSTENPTTPSSTTEYVTPTTTQEIVTTEITPTQPPNQGPSTWYVHDSTTNTTCIVLRLEAEIFVPYKNISQQVAIANITVPNDASAFGSCAEDLNAMQSITLSWMSTARELLPNHTLKMDFTKNHSEGLDYVFSLSAVSLIIQEDPLYFPNASIVESVEALNSTLNLYPTHANNSYRCNAAETIDLFSNKTAQPLQLTLRNMQLEAFRSRGDYEFSKAMDCPADAVLNSDIVPIAVGCALAALVVVVLVAYLIGRRRARQRGYQSV